MDHPFSESPAPWKMKGTVFVGVARSRGLLPGSYGDLEAGAEFATKYGREEDFRGGLCTVLIVRYKDTPVGTYDELMWIPGTFQLPGKDKKKSMFRITRIYVSGLDTIYNGRKNWNIPKTLAHFTFTPAEPNSYPPYSKVTVAPIDQPATPFFTVDITPVPLLSRRLLPISTTWSPLSLDAVTPPLPASAQWRDDGCVGTERWVHCRPMMKDRVGLVKVKGQLGDGKSFPQVDFMQGCWVCMDDATMGFETVDTWVEVGSE